MVRRDAQGADMTADTAFWNKIAEKYSRDPVKNPGAFERKVAIAKSRMRPDAVILDVGCGTGSLALRLAPCAAHVHGLDMSSEMIRIATGKARAQHVDNVTFHIGPFDDGFTRFEAASLDGICAYSLLHLFPDLSAALDRSYRLLKPGAFFISSTVCLGESWVPYRPCDRAELCAGSAETVDRDQLSEGWLGRRP
jgi:arsenite methyltransferase